MVINRLELFNFRNYKYQDVEFSPQNNLFTGRNAQGKSNLLEAIYLLSYQRSKRALRLAELVKEGEERSSIKGLVSNAGSSVAVRIDIGAEGKRVEVNGLKVEPAIKARGVTKCVMFSPDDVFLVKGEPGRRREFLDETVEGKGSSFSEVSQRYRHILRQRNALLKRWEEHGSRFNEMLEPWTEGLVAEGVKIVKERVNMVGAMAADIEKSYRIISGGEKDIGFEYSGTFASVGEDDELKVRMKEELRRNLVFRPIGSLKNRERLGEAMARRATELYSTEYGEGTQRRRSGCSGARMPRYLWDGTLRVEKRMRSTAVGPHRDDVQIRIGKREARAGASQGEQRTLAFCMRIAQKNYMENATGEEPLLLMDDVLSELNGARRKKVLEIVGEDTQAIITSTEEQKDIRERSNKIFLVEGGTVRVG